MQFKSDTEIKKWRPKGNNTRVRCGPKLYVRGFETGRKLFQLRFEVSRKTNWLDVADYPAMSLAVAREMAIAAGRVIKAKDCTVESLRVALTRSDSARSLESRIKANKVTDQPTSTVQTFDEAYRDWYKAVAASNRWKNLASERRPIRSYELHAEKHIGTLPLDKIRRPAIKAFMQPLFTSNPEVAGKLLGYMNKVFLTAFTDEVIEANPCPPKEAFIIPEKNVRHAASLNFSDLPKLMEWLRKAPFSQPVKTAMRLTIVTAHRASVISYMRWEHLDLETGIWTIPQRKEEDRTLGLMKSKRPFATKLPQAILSEIKELHAARSHDVFVFSVDGHKPINAETLRRNFQKYGDITTHGFRNTFKTWCMNQEPPVDDFLADRYLDHGLVGLDKHYRRDNLFIKRSELAERYCAFVLGDGDE